MESSAASLAPSPGEANGEVKPYKIHVSLRLHLFSSLDQRCRTYRCKKGIK